MKSSLFCPTRTVPDVSDDSITDLQEQVLTLLEDAGIPTTVNDQIIALIAAAERSKAI